MGSCAGKIHQKNTITNEAKITPSLNKNLEPNSKAAIGRNQSKQKGALVDNRMVSETYKEAVSAQILEIPKSLKEVELIRNSLAKHFIFRNLNDHYISVIIHHMKLYNLKNSELVFEQGCPGSNFYVVSKGKLEVVISNKRVKILASGDSFGEMALLYDTPRTASVFTITGASLWCLDRKTFRTTVEALEVVNYEENKQFIDSIPVFESLTPIQKDHLVHSLTTHNFMPGSAIVNEGDPGDLLYIIKDGIVLVTKNNQEVRRMGKGFYFGEQALLYSSPRTATVIAVDNVKCVVISGDELKNVLGSHLQDIIYMNSIRISIEKNSYLQRLTKAQIEALIGAMKIKSYRESETIIYQGTPLKESMWIIVRGHLMKSKNKSIIGKVFDAVNADNMITNVEGVFDDDIIASKEVMIAFITKTEFEEKLGGNFNEITSNNEALKILKRIQILRGLDYKSLLAIMQTMKIQEYSDGTIVVEQNDLGDSFFIIKSGKAIVYKNNRSVRTISKHDYFGERSLLFNNFRSATVKAKGQLICWVILKSEFMELLEDSIRKQLLARIELQDDTVNLSDLVVVKTLGSGMFGNVFLTAHRTKRMLYALKTVDRRKILAYDIQENIVLERKVLLELDHIFILKLIRTFKDEFRLYFLLEYIKGMDLFDVLRELGLLNETDSRFYTACLLVIIEHLHEREIIYRDLKPENIVIDDEGYPKLIDFGTSKFIKARTFTIVGTPHYMAPELITGHGYSLAIDIWSIGVITYEFLYGKVPFGDDESDPYAIYEKIQEKVLEFPRWSEKKSKAKEFISQLLNRNPVKRLGGGFDNIKANAWFQGFDWDKLLSKNIKPPYVPKSKGLAHEIENAIASNHNLNDAIAKVEAKTDIPPPRKKGIKAHDDWDAEF